ncbi:MAG: tRNA pseudouridine(38-40) synthase TruA [Nitrospirota bacterium]|nr:MAG: tRNA pseudouridine(38-40) synthase TruA [Nitrospirota bacterium]
MHNIKLTIQYDGTDYAGWQVQPGETTVQGVLEELISRIAPDRTALTAAGRTDSGVHAIEQVASFGTSSLHSPSTIQRSLNAGLPGSIRIIDAAYCDKTFHSRYDAVSKSYKYFIFIGDIASPFVSRYAWRLNYKLGLKGMRLAASHLTGKMDFSSFRASGCGAKSTVREVISIDIKRVRSTGFMSFKIKGPFIEFTVEANAFLRHMVRNIVGTLVEVGRGRLGPEDMKTIIANGDRSQAGPTAPARGLFLYKVHY